MSQIYLKHFHQFFIQTRQMCTNQILPNSTKYFSSRNYVCACQKFDKLNNSQISRTGAQEFKSFSSKVKVTPNYGMLSKIWKKLGLKGGMQYPKSMLKIASLRLYLCTTELVEYDKFFSELGLPDTFSSWFKITQLHLWLIIVRLSPHGEEGRFLRNYMMEWVWKDVEKRIKKLEEGGVPSSVRRESMVLMNEQLRFGLFSYDEGLLGDDRDLAAAVWRVFFDQDCDDPEKVEKVVQYIRKQTAYLEDQDPVVIIPSGLITYLPFSGDEEDVKRTRKILIQITQRS